MGVKPKLSSAELVEMHARKAAEGAEAELGKHGITTTHFLEKEEHIQRARQVIGLTLQEGREILDGMTPDEKRRLMEFSQLTDEQAQALAGAMPERVFRPGSSRVAHTQMNEVIRSVGLSSRLDLSDRAGMRLAQAAGFIAPVTVMNQVKDQILGRVGGFVEVFPAYAPARSIIHQLNTESAETGIGHQTNLVTEAAKTVEQARKNIEVYKEMIRAGAPAIAIKPTAIVPLSTSAVATDSSARALAEALKEIFAEADAHRLPDGRTCEISIDSERSDLVDMVTKALIDAAQYCPNVRIKNAIQAYLRDGEKRQLVPLIETSITRVRDQNGEPLGARLVKGANLPSELQLAYRNGWLDEYGRPMIPITGSKVETDANYMRMLNVMKDVVKSGHFTLTAASMNWFTTFDNLLFCAKAGLLASECQGRVSFAMLRGMGGQPVYRHLQEKFGIKPGMMEEYTPVITMDVLVELFKYYLRRLDELIGKDPQFKTRNFLGALAEQGFASPEFMDSQVRHGYLAALNEYERVRQHVPYELAIPSFRGRNETIYLPDSMANFRPVPKANFGSGEDRRWADELLAECKERTNEDAVEIGLGWDKPESAEHDRRSVQVTGPANRSLTLANVEYPAAIQTDAEGNDICPDIDVAIEMARNENGWKLMPIRERLAAIRRVIKEMSNSRSELVRALAMNLDKALPEADGEVCEIMDFLNLAYLQMGDLINNRTNLNIGTEGDGVALVICPKNFPQAIPAEHIVARLLAGYRVIVKPSGGEDEETILATYEMVKCFWEAGVPKDALIFMPCDNKQAAYLSERIPKIGFTGAPDTDRKIQKANPEAERLSELGGRNVIILDSTTDLKEAAMIAAKSLCGFAGQKCSALRAVICTGDVDFAEFKKLLIGILKGMLVDSALTLHTDLTALSKMPQPKASANAPDGLYEKINNLMSGEEWAWRSDEHPGFGIREVTDWSEFDFSKLEEIFTSVATIMQIPGDYKDAIGMVNGLPGNLTGALLSENRKATDYALQNWKTGVLYVNDTTTGCEAHGYFGNGVGDSNGGLPGASTGSYEWMLLNAHVTRSGPAPYDRNQIEVDEHCGLYETLMALEARLDKGVEIQGNRLQVDLRDALDAGWSYMFEHQRYFSKKRKLPYEVLGKDGKPTQDDWVESRPVGSVIYRAAENDSAFEILSRVFAAVSAGNNLRVSVPPNMRERIEGLQRIIGFEFAKKFIGVELHVEDNHKFANVIAENGEYPNNKYSHIYYARRDSIPEVVYNATSEYNMQIDARPVTGDGLNDLITQYRQQSFSWVYHIAGDATYEHQRRERMSEEQRKREVPVDVPFVPVSNPWDKTAASTTAAAAQ